MQQLIKSDAKQTVITLDKLTRNHLIGISARMTSDGTCGKYILSHNVTTTEYPFVFSSGNGVWCSEKTITKLIEDALNDVRVKVFVFDSLDDLANWIKS